MLMEETSLINNQQRIVINELEVALKQDEPQLKNLNDTSIIHMVRHQACGYGQLI